MDIHRSWRATACGLAAGLAVGLAGAAVAESYARTDSGDHYAMGWVVLVAGKPLCADPFVRPSEREIECRSARPPP